MSAGYWINTTSTDCTSTATTTDAYYTTSAPFNNQIIQVIPAITNSRVPVTGGGQISDRKEFNKYVNASDMLEQFIADMGALGLTQEEFMALPVNAFITWLILKAAVAEGENAVWRCKACGRFTKEGLVACTPHHAKKLLLAA